ncbi:amidase [Pendulispora rubella]|uniref:Amidase n=1 Tax=Pendulispora rubella TaxID=2741070 RepID=A0ABZ2LCS1_9BACT
MARRLPPAPRLSGAFLRAAARAARTKTGSVAVYHALRADLKIGELEQLPAEARGSLPLHNRVVAGRPPRTGEDARLPLPAPPWSGTSASYVAHYTQGTLTPEDVVVRCLAAARELAGRVPTVGPLHEEMPRKAALGEAGESRARYAANMARGSFDGVPIAVKEQTAVRGFARQVGTIYIDPMPMKEDATCVAELRRAGALVLGTTPMTELGMSPSGQNKHRRLPKNPHDPRHIAGGSSTGSGVAVATGLVPFAMGADGGGSIRIPSAINGVFGIKPTWGRVSRAGDYAEGTVAHVGPIASSTADLARVLEAISGPDPLDPETLFGVPAKPAPGDFLAALGRGVRGLIIGVDENEWADASPSVQRAGQDALRALEREGATLQRVRIGLARQAPLIGYMAIGLETRGALQVDWERHAGDMGHDLQLAMAALGEAKAADYVDAQRLRNGLRREVADAFQRVDLLALPTTVDTATAATDDEMASGFLDARVLAGLVRFNFLANLTGLPALSAPVGLDARLLPIGLQLVGDAWDEATVLAASAHLERLGAAKVERPAVSVRILP